MSEMGVPGVGGEESNRGGATRSWVLVRMALVMACLLASPLVADTIHVTETLDDDPTVANGSCSLREAITAANSDAPVDSCASGNGADVIEIPAGTYTLSRAGASENGNSTGDLDITSDITLLGSSVTAVTIDANQIDRVLHVAATNADLVLDSLTITRGRAPSGEHGGAILMGDIGASLQNATLHMTDCIISNSSTQGGSDDGGAIASKRIGSPDCLDCSVTIVDSTLVGNTAADRGGAISNNGNAVTITNSTISGNSAGDDGGGLEITGSFNSFVCNNCTIAGNHAADGGGGFDRGSVIPFILHNTIVADNTSDDPSGSDCEGTGITANYTLIEDTSNCTISGANNLTGDPGLQALADNGGPGTLTHAILGASTAVDAGETHASNGCQSNSGALVDFDQRRAPRAQGAGSGGSSCDLGAFEFDSTGTPVELLSFSIE